MEMKSFHKWWKLIVSLSISLIIGLLMIYVAVNENPQGEFYSNVTGSPHWINIADVFFAWFLPIFIILYLILFIIGVIVSKIRQK